MKIFSSSTVRDWSKFSKRQINVFWPKLRESKSLLLLGTPPGKSKIARYWWRVDKHLTTIFGREFTIGCLKWNRGEPSTLNKNWEIKVLRILIHLSLTWLSRNRKFLRILPSSTLRTFWSKTALMLQLRRNLNRQSNWYRSLCPKIAKNLTGM